MSPEAVCQATHWDPLGKIAAALHAGGSKVIWRGPSTIRAQCPVHHDSRPSLAIDVKDGRVLLKCFAGCGQSTLLKALDLTGNDLFEHFLPVDHRADKVKLTRVANYDYCDQDGMPYARKTRFEPKAFRWERRQEGVWMKGLSGLRPLLFGLEHAVDTRTVTIVEGEKSAAFLSTLGFVAVAPPYGASKWDDAWTDWLWRLGVMIVVILPDNDSPGLRHARRVAASCRDYRPELPQPSSDDPWPVALQPEDPEAAPLLVRLVRLPGLGPSEDAYDWFTTHGHTADDLLRLAAGNEVDDSIQRRRTATRERVRRWRAKHREEERERRRELRAADRVTPKKRCNA